MDGGWENNNQKSFYVPIEQYFKDHPTYHMRDLILPKDTFDNTTKQTITTCVADKSQTCTYS